MKKEEKKKRKRKGTNKKRKNVRKGFEKGRKRLGKYRERNGMEYLETTTVREVNWKGVKGKDMRNFSWCCRLEEDEKNRNVHGDAGRSRA